MRIHDLVEEKKRGGSLSAEEIAYMVREFAVGGIPDYQISTMLMVVYLKGMDDQGITDLILEMTHSGDIVDLSSIEGIKADKHSIGGVGDRTTLATGPIAAAYDVKVAKVSGRGLGYTGGAVDKLESTPGSKTTIPKEEFFRIINENGLALIGQSGDMVPTDKRLYVLRDVTAIVDSTPFIALSIMSKRLTAGSDYIVLNVKTGSDAFMKSLEESISLVREMVSVGTLAGRRCCTLTTDMGIPLGHAIDNSLEMEEAIEILKDHGPEDLACVSLELAANMLHVAGKGNMEQYRRLTKSAMKDKSALQCPKSMVESQDGDGRYMEHPDLLMKTPLSRGIKAPGVGCITHMDIEGIGVAPVMLGAGRNKKEGTIDYSAGIPLRKEYGDRVEAGKTMAVPYVSYEDLFGPVTEKFLASRTLGK